MTVAPSAEPAGRVAPSRRSHPEFRALGWLLGWMLVVAALYAWSLSRGTPPARPAAAVAVVLAAGLVVAWLVALVTRAVLLGRAREAGLDLSERRTVRAATLLETLVIDGVGPLVDGKAVSEVHPIEEGHRDNLRWFAGALARHGTHPAYRAVGRLAARGQVTGLAEDAATGISGSIDRHPVHIGTPERPEDAADVTVERVRVTVDDRLLGTIDLTDRITSETRSALDSLAGLGVSAVLAADGDDERASVIAERLSVERDVSGVGAADGAAGADGRRAVVRRVEDRLELELGGSVAVGSFAAAVDVVVRGRGVWSALRTGRLVVAVVTGVAVIAAIVITTLR